MKSIVSVHLLVSLIYYLTSKDARRCSNHGFPLYFRKDNIPFIADDSRTVGLLECEKQMLGLDCMYATAYLILRWSPVKLLVLTRIFFPT